MQDEHTEIAELRRQLLHFACAVLDNWLERDVTAGAICHFCSAKRTLEENAYWKVNHADSCVVPLALKIATEGDKV